MFAERRRRSSAPLASLAALLCAGLGLAACGGGSQASSGSKASTKAQSAAHASATTATQADTTSGLSPPSDIPPQTVVAQVAGKPIRFAAISHLIAMKSAPEPPPDPPSFSGCVQRAKTAAVEKASVGAARPSEGELKASCQKDYEHLLQTSLRAAIHSLWLLGEGADEKILISPTAVRREFNASKKAFKTQAEFDAYRKGSGQTIADMLSEIKQAKLSDEIFRRIKAKEHPPTSAQVAAYYDSHRKQFAIPQARDVRIFRTMSKAAAIRSKAEIQAGKSFAEVAKQLSAIGQPIEAKNGEVKGLLPGVYEEKDLNDAIFKAKLNQLYGPLELTAKHKTIAPETNSGFFVFEVIKLIPGKQARLGAVRNSIAEELTRADKEKTLSSAIAAFRAKWTARTDCSPGFVVRNCKQYKTPKGAPEDPFTL